MRQGAVRPGSSVPCLSHRRAKRGCLSPGGEGRGSLKGDKLGGGALPCVYGSSCAWPAGDLPGALSGLTSLTEVP